MNASKSALGVIFTTVFVDLLGFGMIIPLVGIYGKELGANAFELAFLGASFSLFQFLFMPVFGSLSDRFGRRPIILISLLGSTFSYLLLGLANSYALLAISRILGGILGANISTAQAYIADVTPPEKRAQGMGLIGAAFGLGFTFGPPIGGWAAAKWGMGAPGIIAASICGLNTIVAYFRLKETHRTPSSTPKLPGFPLFRKSTWKTLSTQQFLLVLFIALFWQTFAFAHIEQTFGLYVQFLLSLDVSRAAYEAGLLLMFVGISGAIVQGGLVRILAKRFGEKVLVIAGLVMESVALALYAIAITRMQLFAFGIFLAIATGLINPCLSSLVSRQASPDQQGFVLGLAQSLSALARIFGPVSALILFDWNPRSPFLLAATITGISAAVLLLSLNSRRKV